MVSVEAPSLRSNTYPTPDLAEKDLPIEAGLDSTYGIRRMKALDSIAEEASLLQEEQKGLFSAYSEAEKFAESESVREFQEANAKVVPMAKVPAHILRGAMALGLVAPEDIAKVHAVEHVALEHVTPLISGVSLMDAKSPQVFGAFARLRGVEAIQRRFASVTDGTAADPAPKYILPQTLPQWLCNPSENTSREIVA